MDEDLDRMSRDELIAAARALRQGIRVHRDSSGHDLCWHHPALWGLLPERQDPLPAVPDWPEFLRGCIRYRQSLDQQLPGAPRSSGQPREPAASFFDLQHGRVHSPRVSSVPSIAERVFGGVTDAQMRVRPAPGLNSLVWLLWHMARVEDVAVNLIVTAGHQVLDDGWSARLGAGRDDVGTGMTEAEVAELTARADVAAVRAYRDAVGLRTREVVAALVPERWAEPVGPADQARAPRGFHVLAGQSRAVELGTAAILHNAMHLGEALTIRSLAGFGAGV